MEQSEKRRQRQSREKKLKRYSAGQNGSRYGDVWRIECRAAFQLLHACRFP